MRTRLFDRMLCEILSLPTAPFCEDAVANHVRRTLERWKVPYRRDVAGNLIARIARGHRLAPLALVAHMDHPGFRVERIESKNSVTVHVLGGVGPDISGYRIRFISDPAGVGQIIGVVKEDKAGMPELVRVRTKGAPPRPGTFGMWDLPAYSRRGQKIRARAIDDVCGVAVMLEVLRRLRRSRGGNVNLYCCFTRAEEVGFVGAAALAKNKGLPKNTQIISIEMSKALPKISVQGDGFVVRLGDRASVFEPRLSEFLLATARAMQANDRAFRFQAAVLDGGTCEATLFNVMGYSSAGVALPLGNYHNRTPSGGVAPEFIDRRDLAGLVDFLTELPRRMGRWDPSQSSLKRRLEKNFRKWKKYL